MIKKLLAVIGIIGLIFLSTLYPKDSPINEPEIALGAPANANNVFNCSGAEYGDLREPFGGSSSFSGSAVISSTVSNTGTYSYQVNPTGTGTGYFHFSDWGENGNTMNFGGTSGTSTLHYRLYFRVDTLPATGNEEFFVPMRNTVTEKIALRVASTGQVVLYDTNDVDIATTTTALSTATWYRITGAIDTGSSAIATTTIYLGDSSTALEEMVQTGLNTNTATHVHARLGKNTNRSGNTVNYYFDDIIFSGSDVSGPGKNAIMQADGDGTYTAFTIGAGSGAEWQQVDEIPPDDGTTYLLSTKVIDEASTVTLESTASAGISGTINCVKPMIKIRNNTAIDPGDGTISMRIRSNGTDRTTASSITSSGYGFRTKIATSTPEQLAWTLAFLDDLEVGMVEKETTDASRFSAGAVAVDYTEAAAPASDSAASGEMGIYEW